MTGQYPKEGDHNLGLYELIELFGAKASLTDLDDHTRVKAGALLLGLNLGRYRTARGLDLSLSFRERDL